MMSCIVSITHLWYRSGWVGLGWVGWWHSVGVHPVQNPTCCAVVCLCTCNPPRQVIMSLIITAGSLVVTRSPDACWESNDIMLSRAGLWYRVLNRVALSWKLFTGDEVMMNVNMKLYGLCVQRDITAQNNNRNLWHHGWEWRLHGRCFYPKLLALHSRYTSFICRLGLLWEPVAWLLAQCSANSATQK